MSSAISLKRGAAWNAVSSIAARAGSLLFWVIAARAVNAHELGMLLAVQTTGLTALLLVSAGFSSASTQLIARQGSDGREPQTSTIVLAILIGVAASALMALALVALAPVLAATVWARPELASPLRTAAAFAFACGASASVSSVLIGLHRFKALSTATLGANAFQLIALLPFLRWFGFEGAIYSLAAGQACLAGVAALDLYKTAFAGARGSRSRIDLKWIEMKTLCANTVWAATAHGAFHVATWGAMAFLLRQPDGLVESAVFGIANQWRQVTLFVPSIAMQVALPAFAALAGNTSRGKVASELAWVNRQMTLWLFLVAASLALVSPLLLTAYGHDYSSGSAAFAALQVTALIQGLQAYRVTGIQGAGRFHLILVLNIPAGAILVLSAFFLSRYGALGLAASHILAFVATEFVLRVLGNRDAPEPTQELPLPTAINVTKH